MKFLFGKKKREEQAAEHTVIPEEKVVVADENMDIAAAISVALSLYSSKSRELEETIITIQKVMKPYSPWNSKIYNLKQMPHRNPHSRMK